MVEIVELIFNLADLGLSGENVLLFYSADGNSWSSVGTNVTFAGDIYTFSDISATTGYYKLGKSGLSFITDTVSVAENKEFISSLSSITNLATDYFKFKWFR